MPFLALIPLRAWLGLALALSLAVGLMAVRSHWIGVGESRVQANWDAQKAKDAVAIAVQLQKVRAIEQAETQRQRDIAADLVEKNREAIAEIDRLDAAVAAGTVRLRQRFACPSNVPGSSTAASGGDAADQPGFSEADARVALRIAADGDAAIRRLTACQAIVRGPQ